MKIRKDYTCPLEITHDIIKGKWKTIILFQLKNGSKSLAELEREINGISQKMLLEQLRELRNFGIVAKENSKGYPLHVEYYLTQVRGMKILDALNIMQEVGIDYLIENGKEEELRCKVLNQRT
ncbi:MAG: winged helix-turn-helix transcriptional regulator [Sedimentibacter sp.]